MKHSEVLIAAKALIEDPVHWAQGDYAYDADGVPTSAHHNDAICFCSLGALRRITGKINDLGLLGQEYLQDAVDRPVHEFNDSSTHADVLAAFDKAIELAVKDGK